MTRRRFVTAAGLAALAALAIGAAKKADPALATAAPMLRPEPVGTSAGRCAFCGSTAHSTLSPACKEGAAPRREVQTEARRRTAGRGRGAR
jgi:hypothetical protein